VWWLRSCCSTDGELLLWWNKIGRTRSMCGVLNTAKSLSFKGSGTVSRGSLSFLDRYACIAMFFLQNAIVAVTHGPSRTLSKCHRNRKTSQATPAKDDPVLQQLR